jgi:hypothetical protein
MQINWKRIKSNKMIENLTRFFTNNWYRIKLLCIFILISGVSLYLAKLFEPGSLPQQFSVDISSGALIVFFTVLIVDLLYAHHDKKMRYPSAQAAVDNVRGYLWSSMNALDKLFNPSYVSDRTTVQTVLTPWSKRLPDLISFRMDKLSTITKTDIRAKTHRELRQAMDVVKANKNYIKDTLDLRSYALNPEAQHIIIQVIDKLDTIFMFISLLPAPAFNLSTLSVQPLVEPPIKAHEADIVLKTFVSLKECNDLVSSILLQ